MPLISSLYSNLERLGGKRRELFTIARGVTSWRYTSGRKPITVTYGAVNVTWTPAPISRERFDAKGDTKGIVAHVKVAVETDLGQALQDDHTQSAYIGIHQYQDSASVVPVLVAYGKVANATVNGEWLEIDVATDDNGLKAEFPAGKIERSCQWMTYSPMCGVPESSFSFSTTIASIDRSQINVASVSGKPDGYFRFGQLVISATKERVYISEQIGNGLTILGTLPTGVAVTDAVALVAGDDQSKATCIVKFNNVLRFSGYNELPQTDPMFYGLR